MKLYLGDSISGHQVPKLRKPFYQILTPPIKNLPTYDTNLKMKSITTWVFTRKLLTFWQAWRGKKMRILRNKRHREVLTTNIGVILLRAMSSQLRNISSMIYASKIIIMSKEMWIIISPWFPLAKMIPNLSWMSHRYSHLFSKVVHLQIIWLIKEVGVGLINIIRSLQK